MQSHLQMDYHSTSFSQSKHKSLYLVKDSFLLRKEMTSNLGFNLVICKDDTVPGIVIMFTFVMSIRTLHNCVSKQAKAGKQENIMSIIIEVDSNSGSNYNYYFHLRLPIIQELFNANLILLEICYLFLKQNHSSTLYTMMNDESMQTNILL